MSCSDYECPLNKECFVPSCHGAACRSGQPVCLKVIEAVDYSFIIDENDNDNILEVDYHFLNPSELRLL